MPGVRPALAVLLDQVREALRVAGAGVERRHVLVALATGADEGVAILDIDLLERLQAVHRKARTHHGHFAHAAGGHPGEHRARVGLQPVRRTKARLEAHAPLPVAQQQLIREQARRGLAAAEVRVAVLDVAFGDAVKGNQQVGRAAVSQPVLGDAGAQRFDVARMLVIVGDEAQLGHGAPAAQLRTDLVVDGSGGGTAILREQRQHEDPLGAAVAQSSERAAQLGSAVEHAELHRQRRQHALRERAGELGTQALRQIAQRRARGRPDEAVLARHAPRTPGQDHPVEQRQPQRARQLHHARVGEEARQEGAHGARCRGLRRAGVDQQDADAFGVRVGHGAAYPATLSRCRHTGT